jgi:hypothetical protein
MQIVLAPLRSAETAGYMKQTVRLTSPLKKTGAWAWKKFPFFVAVSSPFIFQAALH